jgi:hypothetical protein
MGEGELLFSPFFLSDLDFPLEYDIIVYKTLSPDICVLSSPDSKDVELPSYEAFLEAMIMDF